jgi:hypothetical protein
MQNEITYQDNFPEINEEKLKTAARRRDEYSITRDLQMKEDNEAIAKRLAKESTKKD